MRLMTILTEQRVCDDCDPCDPISNPRAVTIPGLYKRVTLVTLTRICPNTYRPMRCNVILLQFPRQ
jgi:hypothetical protein